MENKKYRLMGTLDLQQQETGFVFPVFEKDGNYYFERTLNNLHIKSFEKVDGIDYISQIKRLDENKLVANTKRDFQLSDEAVIAFQEDKDHLFIGTLDDMISYYSNKETNNPFTIHVMDNIKEERARKK